MVWQRVKTRQLQIWTEHPTLIFENLKPVEPNGEDDFLISLLVSDFQRSVWLAPSILKHLLDLLKEF